MLAIIVATVVVFFSLIAAVFSSLRLLFIIQPLRGPPPPRKPNSPTHLLSILGSGGHTAEMLAILRTMDTHLYTHRTYIVSEGDPISAQRARTLEAELRSTIKSNLRTKPGANAASEEAIDEIYGTYAIWTVPRARSIHQPLLTTPISCLRTLIATLNLLSGRHTPTTTHLLPPHVPHAPDLILANGPATSAIVIFAQLILRFLDFGGSSGHERTRIVFVESLARVRTLSLSAKCVGWCVDRVVVQWEELRGKCAGKAEVVGLIVE
jgi:beta-1,4-N-acetylglucosaminyltransferase